MIRWLVQMWRVHVRGEFTHEQLEDLRAVVRAGVQDAARELALWPPSDRVAPAPAEPAPPPSIEELPSCGCGNPASHWIGKCLQPGPPIGQVVREYHALRRAGLAQNTEPGHSVPVYRHEDPAGILTITATKKP